MGSRRTAWRQVIKMMSRGSQQVAEAQARIVRPKRKGRSNSKSRLPWLLAIKVIPARLVIASAPAVIHNIHFFPWLRHHHHFVTKIFGESTIPVFLASTRGETWSPFVKRSARPRPWARSRHKLREMRIFKGSSGLYLGCRCSSSFGMPSRKMTFRPRLTSFSTQPLVTSWTWNPLFLVEQLIDLLMEK